MRRRGRRVALCLGSSGRARASDDRRARGRQLLAGELELRVCAETLRHGIGKSLRGVAATSRIIAKSRRSVAATRRVVSKRLENRKKDETCRLDESPGHRLDETCRLKEARKS
jgi:hypothetical protein